MGSSKRIESVDVLRGLTMALMLIVDNLGGPTFAPFSHAEWNGFTPTDFIFPTFIFVMGVSMSLSLRKSNYKLSWKKVLKRTLLLFGIGLLLNEISQAVWVGTWSLHTLRIMGVLQRFALCYFFAAILVCTVDHKWLGWISAFLLAGYALLLWLGNGYVHGPENILAKADGAVLGSTHVYKWDKGVDPEGLLSTIPAVAHTLIGFLVGKLLIDKKMRSIDLLGTALLFGGFLLMWVLPLNKKVWSPSFVLVVCGLDALLLSLLHYLIDESGKWKHIGFWKVYGTNSILSYILCFVLVWTMTLTHWNSAVMSFLGQNPWTALLYAILGDLIIYLILLPLYKKKIFVKL